MEELDLKKMNDCLQSLIENGEINSLDAAKQDGFRLGWIKALSKNAVGCQSVSNCFINDSDLDIIKELRDLMEDVINGDYKPDSFTNQPINNLIERYETKI
jgi:hypothetical protein